MSIKIDTQRLNGSVPAPPSQFPSKPTEPMRGSLHIFPQELVDTIIDFLSADKSSLLSCALTCRSWFSSSRYHLFHSVRVVETLAERGTSRFLQFYDYLYSIPPTASLLSMKTSIRELTLEVTDRHATHGFDGQEYENWYRWRTYASTVYSDFLERLVRILPELKVVKLNRVRLVKGYMRRRVEIVDYGFGLMKGLCSNFQRLGLCKEPTSNTSLLTQISLTPTSSEPVMGISTLVLTQVTLLYERRKCESIDHLLTLFPGLTTLHLLNCNYQRNPVQARRSTRKGNELVFSSYPNLSNLRIRSLRVAGEAIPPFALVRRPSDGSGDAKIPANVDQPFANNLKRLRELDADCNSTSDLATLRSFISDPLGGGMLKDLNLYLFRYCFISNPSSVPLDLSRCRSLESLTITVCLHRSPSMVEPVEIDYAISILRTLSSLIPSTSSSPTPSSSSSTNSSSAVSSTLNPSLRILNLFFEKDRNFELRPGEGTHRIIDEPINWELVDTVVSHLAKPHVGLKTFGFGYKLNKEDLMEDEKVWVQERLPRVRERGLLVFRK